jgi:hypothetical protein
MATGWIFRFKFREIGIGAEMVERNPLRRSALVQGVS